MLTILRNKRKRVKSFRFPDLYDVQECVSMLANSFTMSFTCNTLVCNCLKILNEKGIITQYDFLSNLWQIVFLINGNQFYNFLISDAFCQCTMKKL